MIAVEPLSVNEEPAARRDGGPADRVKPTWLGATESPADDDIKLRRWAEFVEAEMVDNLMLHPETLRASGAETPLVFARWQRDGDRLHMSAVAALIESSLNLQWLPGVKWGATLNSLKFLKHCIPGSSDEEEDVLYDCLCTVTELFDTGDVDTILFEDVDAEAPLRRALHRLAKDTGCALFFPGALQPHWWIQFPENRDDYWNGFSRKRRYNVQRSVRQLDHKLICYTTHAEVPAFLQKAAAVTEHSWQSKRLNAGIQNLPHEARFFEALAERGALRSYVLEHDGEPIAYAVGTLWHGCFSYEQSAYDVRFAEYSPGTVLLHGIVEDMIKAGTTTRFDFGFGDGSHKRLFGNVHTSSGRIILSRPAWRPRLALAQNQLQTNVASALRTAAKKLHLHTWLRRVYRRADSDRTTPDQ